MAGPISLESYCCLKSDRLSADFGSHRSRGVSTTEFNMKLKIQEGIWLNVSCHLSSDFLSYENTEGKGGGVMVKVEFLPKQTSLTKALEDTKPGYFLLSLACPCPQNHKL